MSKGELAALVFERLEQRLSLSEIVIALRVPPEDARELYHTWLVAAKESTRISIARMVGEFVIPDDTDGNAFVEYRNLCELGGVDVAGPIAVADIMARVGAGEYRVSAYGFEPRGLRWEVFVRLGEEPS